MPIGIPRVPYRLPGEAYPQWVDLYNRLYRERCVFLGSDLSDELANQIIGILSYLNIENSRDPIFLYINSMGGSLTSGLGVYDTMHYVDAKVSTVCVGMAASMASFILAGGERGNRIILPHARVMIHQPSGGTEGQTTDIVNDLLELQRGRGQVGELYCKSTGQSISQIAVDLDRDKFFNAEAAKEYGLVDHIIREKAGDVIEPRKELELHKELEARESKVKNVQYPKDVKKVGYIKFPSDGESIGN
jgi:ATP-dependent Clp protease protease subunit